MEDKRIYPMISWFKNNQSYFHNPCESKTQNPLYLADQLLCLCVWIRQSQEFISRTKEVWWKNLPQGILILKTTNLIFTILVNQRLRICCTLQLARLMIRFKVSCTWSIMIIHRWTLFCFHFICLCSIFELFEAVTLMAAVWLWDAF